MQALASMPDLRGTVPPTSRSATVSLAFLMATISPLRTWKALCTWHPGRRPSWLLTSHPLKRTWVINGPRTCLPNTPKSFRADNLCIVSHDFRDSHFKKPLFPVQRETSVTMIQNKRQGRKYHLSHIWATNLWGAMILGKPKCHLMSENYGGTLW